MSRSTSLLGAIFGVAAAVIEASNKNAVENAIGSREDQQLDAAEKQALDICDKIEELIATKGSNFFFKPSDLMELRLKIGQARTNRNIYDLQRLSRKAMEEYKRQEFFS